MCLLDIKTHYLQSYLVLECVILSYLTKMAQSPPPPPAHDRCTSQAYFTSAYTLPQLWVSSAFGHLCSLTVTYKD